MLAQQHPSGQLSDYVLDLLAPDERRRVDRHLERCAGCREAVRQERAIAHDVRSTLIKATRPQPARLAQLMPPVPAVRRRNRYGLFLRPALALSILLFLFVASLHLYSPGSNGMSNSATATTLAATATTTPTTTAEPHDDATDSANFVEVRALRSAQAIGTPVAAILMMAQN